MNVLRLSAAAAGVLLLAACGGAAPAPGASPEAQPSSPAAAPNPSAASAAAKPSAVSAAAATAGASAKPAAGGLKAVKVGFSQLTGSEGVLYVGADQKSWQKYGIDAEVTRVGGTAMPPAMQSGELQFGTTGGSELVSVNLAGAPEVMIAASHNVMTFSLYGAKGVSDVKELPGKTIAVTTIGSATDAAAHVFMQHYGLDQQVKHQAAGSAQGVLAELERGDAAAGIMSPPTTIQAAQEGMKELANGPKLDIPFVQAGLTVTRAYLQANPDTVKAFLRGYYDAWKFTTNPTNQAAVLQTLMKWTKVDEPSAKATYDYLLPSWSRKGMPEVDPEGIRTIVALSSDPKAKALKMEDIVNTSLLADIQKQG
jgi:NitT/TauT family transport system substrate-binding protein